MLGQSTDGIFIRTVVTAIGTMASIAKINSKNAGRNALYEATAPMAGGPNKNPP